MEIRFHEPREGLEVYEFDGVVRRGVVKDRLDAPALLSVPGEGAGCVEGGFVVWEWDWRGLRGEDYVEFFVFWGVLVL